ncbi:Ger(x)C family spore germination protein [Clostridium sp. CF012]|uniref:Ger(x)C family spore germination protein n=1 Tax=Clostridium sp. CF012 TaxID=2843319 RepID=UPI001C0ACBBE|nr:Ger(x)C family spore germination protein [Clostridium sp. CF012]MBU3146649.1 Ger(x)C family spore germination protein [Clostridium sp. CF012]
MAICPIMLCGCWNYVEINNLAIVAGMAIDKDLITNKYIVTTEIISTQTQGVSSIISSELHSSEGDSIFNAVSDTIEKTGLKLFWSDAKVLIISDSLAKEGVIPVVDWVNRSSDVRSDMWILIAKGNSAAEILRCKVKLNEVTSFHLEETMKSGKTLSKFTDSRLWSFVDGISQKGKSETIAIVKNELNNGTLSPRLEGSAIFKSDKLIGYLNGNETLYMLMIKNKLKKGIIVIKNVSGSDTDVTLGIHENKTKLTPLYNNGIVSLIIDIYPVVTIDEIGGTKNFMEEDPLKILQEEAENKIKTQIQSLISKLQKDYESDILGFEEIFDKEKSKASEIFKKSGKDIFANVKTEVNIHLQINGSGMTNTPIILEN